MSRNVRAQVSDAADLRLKQIEVAMRTVMPDARRGDAMEAAIMNADPKACADCCAARLRRAELAAETN